MRARWPIGTPSSTQSSRSSAGIARKSTPFATNPPAYCGSSSAARNAAMSFGREAGGASTAASAGAGGASAGATAGETGVASTAAGVGAAAGGG